MAGIPTKLPVAVVGAGTMGGGIAQVAAAAGHSVLLYDTDPAGAAVAVERIGSALARLVDKGRLVASEREGILGRIHPCDDLRELSAAALVIEAIVEDLAAKRDLFDRLEGNISRNTILATNTSSLSVTAIGAEMSRPERLVGMHFFNPVPVMALVEVVSGLSTEPTVAAKVFDTALEWGKSPVHARSTPGFIVNRVARPFYAEALRVLGEGGSDPATIDAVMRESGGFRMGPFELMDLIGHDINYAVTQSVFDAYFGDPRFTPSLIQRELVLGGRLGRKTGRGFYDYAQGASRPAPDTAADFTPPERVSARGEETGSLEPLLASMDVAGIRVERKSEQRADLVLDGRVHLCATDGRTATERMASEEDAPLVLLDLASDYVAANRIALARADQASPEDLSLAAGLFQAMGKSVSVLDDVPGLVVMRTICMLANEAADAVNQGVCSAADVDTAMRRGVNYPIGPLDWAQRIGVEHTVRVLDHLATSYGEDRYRVSPLLRRAHHSGANLL